MEVKILLDTNAYSAMRRGEQNLEKLEGFLAQPVVELLPVTWVTGTSSAVLQRLCAAKDARSPLTLRS